jgi:hypothetical protein
MEAVEISVTTTLAENPVQRISCTGLVTGPVPLCDIEVAAVPFRLGRYSDENYVRLAIAFAHAEEARNRTTTQPWTRCQKALPPISDLINSRRRSVLLGVGEMILRNIELVPAENYSRFRATHLKLMGRWSNEIQTYLLRMENSAVSPAQRPSGLTFQELSDFAWSESRRLRIPLNRRRGYAK